VKSSSELPAAVSRAAPGQAWMRDFHADKLGNPEYALRMLCKKLHDAHASPVLWEQLSRALLASEGAPAAAELLRSSLSIYPDSESLRCLFGNTLRMQGRYAESESELRSVLTSDPRHDLATWSLAWLLREQGRFNAAAEVVLDHGSAAPNEPEQARRSATFLAQCGRHQEAMHVCDAALALHEDAPLLGLSGVLASLLGRFERAAVDLRRAVQLNPGLATSWYWLALTHRFQTFNDADLIAMEAAAKTVADDTESGICIGFARGKIYDDLDDIPQAVKVLRRANAAMAARASWQPGRWDALVARQLTSPAPAPVVAPSLVPVFVVGLPRTGTTLITTLLSRHSQIRSRGEMGWLGELATQGSSLGFPETFLTRAAELYTAQLRRDDEPAQFYIDKNPSNFLYLGLAAALFPNARVIHCRRNPRDTALSIWRQYFGSPDTAFAYTFDDIAQVASGHDRLMRHWHTSLPLPIFELEYEALVARPDETVAAVLRFLGTDDSAQPAGTAASPMAIGTASVWQARQPVNTRSVGRWKSYASELPELLKLPDQ